MDQHSPLKIDTPEQEVTSRREEGQHPSLTPPQAPGLRGASTRRALGNQAIVQARADGGPGLLHPGPGGRVGSPREIRTVARQGVSGPGVPLPHLEHLHRVFPGSDLLERARAHWGETATQANQRLGARAYATHEGGIPRVAFREAAPDLPTTLHEVAHLHQQARGQTPPDGIGSEGDILEQAADQVAAGSERGGGTAPGGAASDGVVQGWIEVEEGRVESNQDERIPALVGVLQRHVEETLRISMHPEGVNALRRIVGSRAGDTDSGYSMDELKATALSMVLEVRSRAAERGRETTSAMSELPPSEVTAVPDTSTPTEVPTVTESPSVTDPSTTTDPSVTQTSATLDARAEPATSSTGAPAPTSVTEPDPTEPGARTAMMAEHLGTLFATARLQKSEFKAMVRRWASGSAGRPAKGRRAVFRPEARGTTRSDRLYTGMKKVGRSVTKSLEKVKYEGKSIEMAVRDQTDILAATIEYESLSAMLKHMPILERRIAKDGELVALKNRTSDPNNRDMLLNVRLRSGLTVELQLHFAKTLDRKQASKGVVPHHLTGIMGMGSATTHQVYDVKRELQSLMADLPRINFTMDRDLRGKKEVELRHSRRESLRSASSLADVLAGDSITSPRTPRSPMERRSSSRIYGDLERYDSLRRTESTLDRSPSMGDTADTKEAERTWSLTRKLTEQLEDFDRTFIEERKRVLKRRYNSLMKSLSQDLSITYEGAPGKDTDELSLALTTAPFDSLLKSPGDESAESSYQTLKARPWITKPKRHDLSKMASEVAPRASALVQSAKKGKEGPTPPTSKFEDLKKIYTQEAESAITRQGGVPVPRTADSPPESQLELICKYRFRLEEAYHRTHHEELVYRSKIQELIDVMKEIEELYQQMETMGR